MGDELIGNFDIKISKEVIEFFKCFNEEKEIMIILVMYDCEVVCNVFWMVVL